MISMRGVTVDEEKKKKKRVSYQVYLYLSKRRESRVSAIVREGRGIPVCSVQGRGAD